MEERRERVERVASTPAGEPVERVERERSVQGVAAPSTSNVNVSRPAARPAAVSAAPDYSALVVAKVNQLLWFVCGILELLLIARVILLLLGANRATPFAQFIYTVTQPFAWPFLGLFPNAGASPTAALPSGSVFEVTTLLAMVVYFLLFLLLTQLLRLLVSRPRVMA